MNISSRWDYNKHFLKEAKITYKKICSYRYQHLILWDPELSLVSNVVTHSNTIARSFLTSSPLTPDDISRVWRSSALSSSDIFRSNILTISGSDKYLRFILPVNKERFWGMGWFLHLRVWTRRLFEIYKL